MSEKQIADKLLKYNMELESTKTILQSMIEDYIVFGTTNEIYLDSDGVIIYDPIWGKDPKRIILVESADE